MLVVLELPNSVVSFSSAELYHVFQLIVWVLWPEYASLSPLTSTLLSGSRQLLPVKKNKKKTSSDKPTVHNLFSTKPKTDKVNDKLVNTLENLAATETDIFLRSWWKPKTELRG